MQTTTKPNKFNTQTNTSKGFVKPRRLLELERSGEVSVQQGDWLINSLNPFADYLITPTGMPDTSTEHTVVKTVQKTMTISRPSTLLEGETWDLFICTLPVDFTGPNPDSNRAAEFETQFSGSTASTTELARVHPVGVLSSYRCRNGLNPIPWAQSYAVNDTFFSMLNMNDAWTTAGSYRYTSFGYEVTNVTPALYRGGSLVSFRKETSTPAKTFIAVDFNALNTQSVPLEIFSGYPFDYSSCLRIPGAKQWNAEEGAYVVCTFDEDAKQFNTSNAGSFLAIQPSGAGINVTEPGVYYGTVPFTQSRMIAKTHLDMSGVYCSGLSFESVITVTVKCIMEIVPANTSELIDFIRPGVIGNSKLDDVYSAMKAQLPPAVKRDANDLGTFFATVTDILTPVLSMAFPRFAPVINTVGGAVSSALTKPSKTEETNTKLTKREKLLTKDLRESVDKIKQELKKKK